MACAPNRAPNVRQTHCITLFHVAHFVVLCAISRQEIAGCLAFGWLLQLFQGGYRGFESRWGHHSIRAGQGVFFVLACFRFGACAPSPCAKCAPNQPKTAPAIHREATERTPARTVRGPAAGLSVSPFGPSVTVLLTPLLPVCLPVCLPLGYPSGVHPSATPRLPLGVRLCPSARLPLAPSARTAATARLDRPKRKADRPTERPAPRRSIFPYALGPAVKLAPQRVGGGIRDICHQPPRIPRIDVARQLRNG